MKTRLYLYNSHDGGQTYVYDTGTFDPSAPPGRGCINNDPQQFGSIQDMLSYSLQHNEMVQQVGSVAEVNQICSGTMANVAPSLTPPPIGQSPMTPSVIIDNAPPPDYSGMLPPSFVKPTPTGTAIPITAAIAPGGIPWGWILVIGIGLYWFSRKGT